MGRPASKSAKMCRLHTHEAMPPPARLAQLPRSAEPGGVAFTAARVGAGACVDGTEMAALAARLLEWARVR